MCPMSVFGPRMMDLLDDYLFVLLFVSMTASPPECLSVVKLYLCHVPFYNHSSLTEPFETIHNLFFCTVKINDESWVLI